MLTPNDVRHRKFRTYRSLLYGEVYDAEDVDDFLDSVPSRFMRKIICRLRLNEVSRQ